jgi:hypothetical protein
MAAGLLDRLAGDEPVGHQPHLAGAAADVLGGGGDSHRRTYFSAVERSVCLTVAAIGARRRELAEAVPDHVLGDEDRHMRRPSWTAIV